MRANFTMLQGALVLLLAGSAILFFVGSTSERHHRHHETAAPAPAKASGSETGSETGGEGSKHTTEPATGEAGVKLLGVNTESLALSIVAVVLSFLLAAAVLARVWAKMVLAAVAVFGLVFAAADGRELVHQIDDSNGGLATLAGVLIGLHLTVALVAVLLSRQRVPATSRT